MKQQLFEQLRSILNLPQSDRMYFTQDEVYAIASAIDSTFNQENTDYSKVFSTVCKSWEYQKTIERHPTLANLSNLLREIESTSNYSLRDLISMMPTELMDVARSIRLDDNQLIITLV